MKKINAAILKTEIEKRIENDIATHKVGCAAACVMQGGELMY